MKRIGVSELRKFNRKSLRELSEPLEICHHNQPLRVLIPYEDFLYLQAEILRMQREVAALERAKC